MVILDKDLYNNKTLKFYDFIDYINKNWKKCNYKLDIYNSKIKSIAPVSTIHRFIKILDF